MANNNKSSEARLRSWQAYEEREKRVRKRVELKEKNWGRWNELKVKGGFETNDEFAESLMAMYVTQQPVTSGETTHGRRNMEMFPVTASTPFRQVEDLHIDSSRDAASVHSDVSSTSSVSGIDPLEGEESLMDETFDVTVNYKHDKTWEPEEDSSDEEVDDEADITIHAGPLPQDILTVGDEEEVMGEVPDHQNEEVEECEETRSGLHAKVDAEEAAEASFFIVSRKRLRGLCREARGPCRTCGKATDIQMAPAGTSVHVKWVCPDGHTSSWCAQETLQRSHVGDMKLASSIVMTGNNFRKISLLARFMSLHMISSATFHAHQRKYVAPAIEAKWEGLQDDILSKCKEAPVVVCGDGRNDSPGFSARYLTYVVMDHSEKNVLDVQIVEKRETGGNSPAMELEGLKRSLTRIQEAGVEVEEMVTDAHPSITKYMREKQPAIRHSWDIWHAGKNLGKKITKAAGKVSTKALMYWVRHVIFHFWWCAETCGRRSRAFIAKWRGLTHHVTNKHEWVAGLGEGVVQCQHAQDLPDNREEWLTAGSPPHRALVEICYEKRFLKNLDHFLTFRHTSMIESLNNHILMYASKRFSFGYRAYRARNLMAVIDYQAHKERPNATDEHGNPKYLVRWSKHAGQYVTIGVKQPKTYPYIREMMLSVLQRRVADTSPLFASVDMMPTDPRHIRPRLAAAPLPSVEEILGRRKSRFSSSQTATSPHS